MKKFESKLDEQQELQLLKIEHNGCWIAFWGLLAAILVQQLIFGYDMSKIAGEWIVFMALAVYMAVDCSRHGIWDRRLQMNRRTNLAVSALAGGLFGLWMLIMTMRNFPDKLGGSIAAAIVAAVLVFVICFAALELTARSTKKRIEAQEAEPEEEAEILAEEIAEEAAHTDSAE